VLVIQQPGCVIILTKLKKTEKLDAAGLFCVAEKQIKCPECGVCVTNYRDWNVWQIVLN